MSALQSLSPLGLGAQKSCAGRARNVRFAAAFAMYSFLAPTFFFAGCKPEAKLPLTGSVSLQFVRKSQSGIHFRLANQSSKAISFRGVHEGALGASPWDTQTECKAARSEFWTEGPFALVDGPPHSVEVSPGEQLELVFEGEFADRYKGGHCRVSLLLLDETLIKSDEFEL